MRYLLLVLTCITILPSFGAKVEIDNLLDIKEAKLMVYKDYFSKEISEVAPQFDSSGNRLMFEIKLSTPSLCLIKINGIEEHFMIAEEDQLVLQFNTDLGLTLSSNSKTKNFYINNKIKEITQVHEGFGKSKSKKEYNLMMQIIKNQLDSSEYHNKYIGFYGIQLMLSHKKYRKHLDVNELATVLENNWYQHNVPTYIDCFKQFTNKVAWWAFHEREIGLWRKGDSNDIKILFNLTPFKSEALNKTYQLYMLEMCEAYRLIWRKSYGEMILKNCMDYFKTEKHLPLFVSAYNFKRNYYGTEITSAYHFQMLDIDSNTVDLSSLNENFVLIDFWATWCMPCIKGMSELNQFQKDNPNIKVIMISRDRDFKSFKTFVKESEYDLAFYYCGESKLVQAAYQIQSLPHKVLIGNDKNIYLNRVLHLEELNAYKAFWN